MSPLTARRHDCPMCIDGFQPVGIHPVLGPVLVACEFTRMCTACGGCSWFPTDRTALTLRANRLAASGYAITYCLACLGISDVLPIKGDPR
ncbi:hypothetical protein AB0K00_40110 [Dactylosporangium sp. NPDC049525]|uniref:hypothetical protein n=1 Tax=Dactylosporangium sp. NPDC049525 TaxID=3154730 RepID=UPI00343B6B7B